MGKLNWTQMIILPSDCRGEQTVNPDVALEFLANHCKWAVVTLAANGCIAKHGKEVSEMWPPVTLRI